MKAILQRGDLAFDEPFTDRVRNDLHFLELGGIIDGVYCLYGEINHSYSVANKLI